MSAPDHFRVRIVNIRSRHHNQPWADDEASGLFHFKHDLLEQLPVYLAMIKKMASADPDAYKIYSNIGGLLLPPNAMLSTTLADVDTSKIPSFVCALFGSGVQEEETDKDTIWPRLMYLQKIKNPPGVQLSSGDIYSMTMFYTRNDEATGYPLRYHVAVGSDGNVRLLRELQSSAVSMRSKRGSHQNRHYKIPLRNWQIPRHLQTLAKESDRDVNQLAQTSFCFLAGIAPRMRAGFQVRAHRSGPRAVFNIPLGRTPYFFKDREAMTTERGMTKKIFHYVPGYQRSDGVIVKGHTKGLRQFKWKTYNIHIGMPGMDFPDVNNFKSAAVVVDADEITPPNMVDSEVLADTISKEVENSSWWVNRKKRR